MLKVTLKDIINASYEQRVQMHQTLIIDKMKLDRFFSVFLDNAKLDENDLDHVDWVVYKSMLKDYTYVEETIKTMDYYLNGI